MRWHASSVCVRGLPPLNVHPPPKGGLERQQPLVPTSVSFFTPCGWPHFSLFLMYTINSLYNLAANEQDPAHSPPSYSIRAGFRFNPPHQLLNTVSGHTYCAQEFFKAHSIQRPDFVDVSGRDQFITMCRWTGPEAGIAVSKVDNRVAPPSSCAPLLGCRTDAGSSQGAAGRTRAPSTVLLVRISGQS